VPRADWRWERRSESTTGRNYARYRPASIARPRFPLGGYGLVRLRWKTLPRGGPSWPTWERFVRQSWSRAPNVAISRFAGDEAHAKAD